MGEGSSIEKAWNRCWSSLNLRGLPPNSSLVTSQHLLRLTEGRVLCPEGCLQAPCIQLREPPCPCGTPGASLKQHCLVSVSDGWGLLELRVGEALGVGRGASGAWESH